MKKYFILLLLPVCIVNDAYSQAPPRVDPVLDQQHRYLNQIPMRPPGTVGSVYLADDWMRADIHLKKEVLGTKELRNVSVKLDMKDNMFEFYTDQGIRVLEGAKVDTFRCANSSNGQNEVFLNCDLFTFEGTKLIGFCKVLSSSGKVLLVERNYVDIIKADYNIALNVGSKDDRIIKKTKRYFIRDNKMIEYDKRSFYVVVGEKEAQVKKFMKEQKLNLNEEEGLLSALNYYNTL
jgi:hypothetical protein